MNSGHGLVQIGPDGRLQYEYMLKDNQAYTELVVIDPNESCAPVPSAKLSNCSVQYDVWRSHRLLHLCKHVAPASELASMQSMRLQGSCVPACSMPRASCSNQLSLLHRASH